MRCVAEPKATLPDGRTLMRCINCGKQRAFKTSDPRAKMQCGKGKPIIGGPGTELRRIFKELDVKAKSGCNCKEYAARMDAWGVDVCRARMPEIMAHLEANARQFGLGQLAGAVWSMLWQGKPTSLEGLVTLAIERASASAA